MGSMTDAMNNLPIVVFILGYGRSGSTLLDRLLGSIDECFSCGEIVALWRSVGGGHELCSCGQRLDACDFWGKIIKQLFWEEMNPAPMGEHLEDLFPTHGTIKGLVRLYFSKAPFGKKMVEARKGFKENLGTLYHKIREVSGAKVIIDSSKLPAYGEMLCEVDTLDVRIVHLVRDSRAVMYSNIRKRYVPQIGYTATQNSLRTICGWTFHNLLASKRTIKQNKKFVCIRYEDLAKAPGKVLLEVGHRLNLWEDLNLDPHNALNFLRNNHTAFLRQAHMVAGNAFRFEQGNIRISLDEQWKKKLGLIHKFAGTFITAPLLKYYGYSLNWGYNKHD